MFSKPVTTSNRTHTAFETTYLADICHTCASLIMCQRVGGWDGRSRMSSIDTKKCPVYMLTGEYDWSNTPEMGQATCDKIKGGKHQAMKGMGHFPATENPK